MKALVEDLLEGVDMDGRAGLAANQIGVSLRAFSWNIDGEIGYVLNPRIVALSEDEYQDGDEGCLSVPDLWYPTERAWYARCEGTDLDGKKLSSRRGAHGSLHPARVRPPRGPPGTWTASTAGIGPRRWKELRARGSGDGSGTGTTRSSGALPVLH